jgi:hypothetical protein
VPKLLPSEVYRAICPVDLAPVLSILGKLPFFAANISGGKYACDVVLQSQFPPELKTLLASLPLGGTTARAMLRRLGPRQSIPTHIDQWMPAESDWRRFQVPVTSHPDILMRWPDDNVAVHLAPGTLYEVRFDRPHEVIHAADSERIHLQVDQVDATI